MLNKKQLWDAMQAPRFRGCSNCVNFPSYGDPVKAVQCKTCNENGTYAEFIYPDNNWEWNGDK